MKKVFFSLLAVSLFATVAGFAAVEDVVAEERVQIEEKESYSYTAPHGEGGASISF